MTCGIYKIENLINHNIYIGQSIHIEKRWKEHCQPSHRSLISKAILKYGKENFSFQILEECPEELLDEREEYYIHKYNSITPYGYNVQEFNDGRATAFNFYDKEVFINLINDIKDNLLSFEEIAEKYDLCTSMIYYLNRGDYHTLENESYPLRPVKDLKKKYHYCCDCGKEITKGAIRCLECDHLKKRKAARPSREELKQLIYSQSFVSIGRLYGVTDNAVRKWCNIYNLPTKKKEIRKFTVEQWKEI